MEALIQEAEEKFQQKISLFPKFLADHEDAEVRALIEQLCILFVLNGFKNRDEKFLLKNWDRIRPIVFDGKPFHILSIITASKNLILEEFTTRLKEFEIYKIADKKTIYDYLAGDMRLQISLQKNDIAFLKNVKENPLASYSEWGREFNISRQAARKRWGHLGERFHPQIFACINYKKIKLRLLFGYVNVGKRLFLLNNLSTGILNSVFGRSVGKFRSSLSEIYFTFQVPEDHRCQAFLEKSFKKMADSNLIESYKLIEFISASYGINFDLYNVKKNSWIFNPELWLKYLKYYLPEYDSFEESPTETPFEMYSSKFDRIDLGIMDALAVDGRITDSFLTNQLDYTRGAIRKKRERLIKENFVNIYLVLRNVGLDGFFMLLMEGDGLARIRFKKACLKFPQWQFYDYIGKSSVKGSIFAFEIPNTQMWKLYCYLDGLTPDYGIKKLWYNFFPVGSLPLSNLIERWDERRQRWRWNQSDFDLISLSKIERYL
ncbi:MAG: hypothetical protein Q6356_006250 [Candidatus Wukongarchaeota archaeon]|nr:Lrp/AsnC family transcriptional regulator [Candidatus Wukongarchaeota archaeon]